MFTRTVNVKQSLYRPGQTQRIPGGWGSQISRQSAHKDGQVFRPTHRPPLPTGNTPCTHFCRGWVNPRAIVRPEGLCQWKIPMTTSGIEPATFRLVAQCLNQLRHRHTYQNILISTKGKTLVSAPKRPERLLGQLQPPIKWILRAVSPGIKRPGLDVDRSPPSNNFTFFIFTYYVFRKYRVK